MPASPRTEEYLRDQKSGGRSHNVEPSWGDGFLAGDYSLGLFHHDASESSIELLRHPEFRDAAAGSLLDLFECASPDGCVHRAELPYKTRDGEPAKPVLAQYTLRVVEALGADGLEWAERHRVFESASGFIRFIEANYVGLHGLFVTHSSRQSGFDSDILTAGLPPKSVEAPDTNAFMVLEYLAMAQLSRKLGRADAEWEEKASKLRERIEQLLWWDEEETGYYVGLRWQHGATNREAEIVGWVGADGRIRPCQSWTGLLPLYAGIPSPERATQLIRKLIDPTAYWGPFGIRTIPADDIFFHQAPRVMVFDERRNQRGPVSNWSGPIWVLANYYLASGLARYRQPALARELALKTARLLTNGLARHGSLHECYNDAGQGLWPAQGNFVSWNLLALALLRDTAG
jgi:putative isomerase